MSSSATLIPLLLAVFPLAMAGGCLILRDSPRLVLGAGLATIAAECALALSAPLGQPSRLLAVGVDYDAFSRLLVLSLCGCTLLAMLAAWAGEQSAHFVPTALVLVGCGAAIALVREPLAACALLLLGGMAACLQQVDRPAGSGAAIRPRSLGIAIGYLVMIVLSGVLMLWGATLIDGPPAQRAGGALRHIGLGMLLSGYAVRAGLLPFHLWLPELVDDAAPAAATVHAALLTALALPVLVYVLEAQPELFAAGTSGRRLLLGLGALSALGGAALALGGTARRRLAFLAIANVGLLTLGVGTASAVGIQAALLGMVGHMLGIGLAMLGGALLESTGPGARARWPGTLALVLGVLLLVGVPPFAGFAPRLLLLSAAWQNSALAAAIVAAGSSLMALAAARLLSDVLNRGPAADRAAILPAPGSPVLPAVTLAVCLVVAVAGLWPLALSAEAERAVRGMSFVAPP